MEQDLFGYSLEEKNIERGDEKASLCHVCHVYHGDKFFEILLHQMPKRLQQSLEEILLPKAKFSTNIFANKQTKNTGSLLAVIPQNEAKLCQEAWCEQWYAHCIEQAQHSAGSCWKLFKDFGFNYYVQESYFENCYRQSSLSLDRELSGDFAILLQNDPRYPSSLLELQQAPRLIFWRGHFLPPDAKNTAIIGTRKAGLWGIQQAWQEALLLQKEKVEAQLWCKAQEHWIISGLAHGCDAAAHRGAIDAGGPTLALLPGGLDCIYPKQHRSLAQEIIDSGGALATEYVPTAEPMKWRFIQRDRLQSALAQRILLVESPLNGGSMHTVRAALQLGKPVFTLEGTEHCWQFSAAEIKEGKKSNLKGSVRLDLLDEIPKTALLGANQALLREGLAQPWISI